MQATNVPRGAVVICDRCGYPVGSCLPYEDCDSQNPCKVSGTGVPVDASQALTSAYSASILDQVLAMTPAQRKAKLAEIQAKRGNFT